MPLSTQEIKPTFDQTGFVIIPNLFSREEAMQMKTEMQRIIAEVREAAMQAGQSPESILPSGVYVGLAARSEFYRRLVADQRLLEVLTLLIGPQVEFLSDKAVFKNDRTTFSSPWHQDWPYWQGDHKISVWIALDDVTPENGCLKLLPGSHQQVAIHDGDASDGFGFAHRLAPEALDESRAATAALEAGGAAFFHDLTLHASYPNTTGRDRWVWIPTYRDAVNDDPPYSWAVAARIVSGG